MEKEPMKFEAKPDDGSGFGNVEKERDIEKMKEEYNRINEHFADEVRGLIVRLPQEVVERGMSVEEGLNKVIRDGGPFLSSLNALVIDYREKFIKREWLRKQIEGDKYHQYDLGDWGTKAFEEYKHKED